eukprot:CAMPEP_0118653534 /NCGR_PEP_ID=MMETSP0785-20121206/11880_1 /TAXON_ID=91992 /ORGANISM="Bolidomonas pacifica, Strain CCMP 1866" /LENGTH=143 /DNA_ID=CAMNT_0006546079 /DNA_START=21 /DNA_END=449 /DNA_ORIENTATION=-
MGGGEEELSVEKRRKLHAVCLKANAIIRGCATYDTGGNGKVDTEVFVAAVKKSVDVGDDDIERVLSALQGEQEDKSYVKYSGLVFKIGLYLDKHVVLKEEDVEDREKKGVEKNVLISGGEIFGGDIYTNSSSLVYEGGKKHFE